MKKSVDKTKKMCYNEFTKENKKKQNKKGEKTHMSMIQISVKAGAVKVENQENLAQELQKRAELEAQGIEVSPVILEGTTTEILKYISANDGIEELEELADSDYDVAVEKFLANVSRSERYFTIYDEKEQTIEYDLEELYNKYKEDEDVGDWDDVAKEVILSDSRVTKADVLYLESTEQIDELGNALIHYDIIHPDLDYYEN